MWTDHYRCRWPAGLETDEARATYFAKLNNSLVSELAAALPPSRGRAPPPAWDKRQTYAEYGETPLSDELWSSIDAEAFFTARRRVFFFSIFHNIQLALHKLSADLFGEFLVSYRTYAQ